MPRETGGRASAATLADSDPVPPAAPPGRQATNAELFDSLLDDAASRIESSIRRAKSRGSFDRDKIEAYANKTLEPFGLRFTEPMLTGDIFQILKDQRNEI